MVDTNYKKTVVMAVFIFKAADIPKFAGPWSVLKGAQIKANQIKT